MWFNIYLLVAVFAARCEGGTESSPILLSVKLPYVTNKDCRKGVQVVENKLCVGGVEGKSPCLGDSGGSLVHNHFLVGIVSHGRKCGGTLPVMFNRVSDVWGFIDTTVDEFSNSHEDKLVLS